MTGEERCRLAQAKFDRALHHAEELATTVKEYFRKEPYKLGFKVGEDGRPVYFVDTVEDVPPLISIMLGDVLHNLRCCLDHLAYQLVWVKMGAPPTDRNKLYFPICESATKYNKRKQSGDPFFLSASVTAVAAVDSLKPYKGGNDPLWWLHALNNIDKHRMLITAGGKEAGVDLGLRHSMFKPLLQDMLVPEEVRQALLEKIAKESLFFASGDPMFPLKTGDVFFIDAPGNEFNPDVKLKVYLALNEEGIPSDPLDQLLQAIGEAVATTINTLRPCLA